MYDNGSAFHIVVGHDTAPFFSRYHLENNELSFLNIYKTEVKPEPIEFVDSSSVNFGTATTGTLNLPTGLQAGDLVIVQSNSSNAVANTITSPG
jgi:hypothetical protein